MTTRVKTDYDVMTDERIMEAAFDEKCFLEKCYELPTRDPEKFYNTKRTRVPGNFQKCVAVTRQKNELKFLIASGVPPLLAEDIIAERFIAEKTR